MDKERKVEQITDYIPTKRKNIDEYDNEAEEKYNVLKKDNESKQEKKESVDRGTEEMAHRREEEIATIPIPIEISAPKQLIEIYKQQQPNGRTNLISPPLRLWSAKDAMKNGCKMTATTLGISCATVRRWLAIYQTHGDSANIFQLGHLDAIPVLDGGKKNPKFSLEAKREVTERAKRENPVQVAYEYGIHPDTITKWRRKINLIRKSLDYNNQ